MEVPRPDWAIIVHGGAKSVEPEQEEASLTGCRAALEAGQAVLGGGGSAVEAVEATIRVLEDDPTFNAGYGSVLNAAGEVEMEAALMDGATRDVGGVAVIQGVRHPISVARLLLREKTVLLAGPAARRYAAEHGASLCDPAALIAKPPRDHGGNDTVGCVALDRRGHLATGASTGGLSGAPPGRVSDSALPGGGLYADDAVGAVALSGEGEAIARMVLAAVAMAEMRTVHPQQAVDAAVARIRVIGGEAGAIGLDSRGRPGWAHNSSHMPTAFATSAMSAPLLAMRRQDAGRLIHV